MWKDLLDIAEKNYKIKHVTPLFLYLNIPKLEGYDIEIMKGDKYTVYRFMIKVWYLGEDIEDTFNKGANTLSDVINHINFINRELPKALRLR